MNHGPCTGVGAGGDPKTHHEPQGGGGGGGDTMGGEGGGGEGGGCAYAGAYIGFSLGVSGFGSCQLRACRASGGGGS